VRTSDLELGYLAHSAREAQPGVVMIHDVWGLSDHTRDLARRLASEGFSVLAADLYRREAEVSISDPGAWIRGLSDPQVIADLQAAVDHLAVHPSVGGRRVGITGFCMGGQYVLLAAAGCRGLSAAVSFYGMLSHSRGLLAPPPDERLDPARKPRSPLEAAAAATCPVLGLFGADDPYVSVDDVRELERRLERSGQPHEIEIYPGAGHAFMNDTRPEMYRPEVARRAWERMLGWFRAHLDAAT
jgi:carboxymethylenebutenolidase